MSDLSDVIDQAGVVEAMWTEIAIRQAHVEANAPAKEFDRCQFCGVPTDNGAEFCSYGPGSCADDAKWLRETKKRTGVVQ